MLFTGHSTWAAEKAMGGCTARWTNQLVVSTEGADHQRHVAKKVTEENAFTTDRGLNDYRKFLGTSFNEVLSHLSVNDRWVDGGAGFAYAQRDFLGSRDGHVISPARPQMIAITFKYPPDQPKTLGGDRLRVLSGRYFEEIPPDEIGPADLITDVTGVLNYTESLDRVLDKYLRLLRPKGSIFVFIPTQVTAICTREHKLESMFEWLASIKGLEVEDSNPSIAPEMSGYSFRIRKIAAQVKIPRLKLVSAFHLPASAVFRLFAEDDKAIRPK